MSRGTGAGVSPIAQYTLSTGVDPTGSGTVTLNPTGGTYNAGTAVSLTAVANSGYLFNGWNGDVAETDVMVTTTTMDADKTITALFVPDSDNDGMSTEDEQGPQGTDAAYDGDNSGTPDSQEANVASGPTFDDTYYVTLAVPATETLANVDCLDNPSPSDSPNGVTFPYGFFEFAVTGLVQGSATTVTIYLPAAEEPTTYWKYGPTPTDPTNHWYEFIYDGSTGAEFDGNVITLHFIDGERGDDDLTANGVIIDQGAPGEAVSSFGICFITATENGSHATLLTVVLFTVGLLIFNFFVSRRMGKR